MVYCLDESLAKENWSSIPFYVYAVGSSTAAVLPSLAGPTPSPYSFSSTHGLVCPYDVRGSNTGICEKLAHFIVSDQPIPARLLYLTDYKNKNRDTLPKIIEEDSSGRMSLLEKTRGISLDAVDNDLSARMSNIAGTLGICARLQQVFRHVLSRILLLLFLQPYSSCAQKTLYSGSGSGSQRCNRDHQSKGF